MRVLITFVFLIELVFKFLYANSQELLIKPSRTISFTTDEGSFMNVDISPDDKTLVFDLLGNIYTVPASGGQATQLTRGMAINLNPTWSPDGSQVAFNSDASGAFHLTFMDLKNTFQKTIDPLGKSLDEGFEAFNAHWSPDGHYICSADTLYSVEGGKVYTKLPLKYPVRFSPNGDLIYGVDSGEFCLYDRLENVKRSLLPVPRLSNSYTLSPDFRWFCYILDSNDKKALVVEDLSNHTKRILIPSLIERHPHYTRWMPVRHFSISSDSKYIFIGYAGKIHKVNLENGTNNIIPFSATVKVDLGPYDYNTFYVSNDSFHIPYIRNANVSSDGKHLVFESLSRIYIMELPGGKPHELVPQSENQFQPVFSPDGRWIAYVTWSDTSGGALWKVLASGEQLQKMAGTSGQYRRPSWSPDASSIAVIKSPANLPWYTNSSLGQLDLISISGKEKTLDDSVPLGNLLAFTAGGQNVIYTPKFKGYYNNSIAPHLMSKNINNDDKKIIAAGTKTTSYEQKVVSPDERYIVYSIAEDLYIIPVCRLSTPTLTFTDITQTSAIRFAAGVDPYWEKNGKVLAWTYGNCLYRINPEKIVAAAEKQGHDNQKIDDFITVTVKPDQVIKINLSVPANYAHGLIALKDARIITMDNNKVIDHGTILIQNGRIIDLGPSATITIPSGIKTLMFSGKTIIPGFVDTHLHLHLSPEIRPQEDWTLLASLAYGVTTARDPASNLDAFGYAESLKSGRTLGPRLFTVGHPVRNWDGVIRLDNMQDADEVVRKRALMGSIVIKQYDMRDRIRREWVLLASQKYGLNMTNEGNWIPAYELAMIKDGSTGIEHNPIWDDAYLDYIKLYATSKIYLTPTLQVSYSLGIKGDNYGARDYFNYLYWHVADAKLARFSPDFIIKYIQDSPADSTRPDFLYQSEVDARILHAGGRICMGSHGNDEGIGVHNELWALQMGGMSNMEALRCATLTGAEALGLQKDIGSLEVGKIADLIVLDKNPLDDIHNSREIRYVMKDGILYDGDTLDEIWPEQKKCPDWKLHSHTASN